MRPAMPFVEPGGHAVVSATTAAAPGSPQQAAEPEEEEQQEENREDREIAKTPWPGRDVRRTRFRAVAPR